MNILLLTQHFHKFVLLGTVSDGAHTEAAGSYTSHVPCSSYGMEREVASCPVVKTDHGRKFGTNEHNAGLLTGGSKLPNK